MVKVRNGEDFGVDLERVIGWVLVKDCCREYQFPSLGTPIEKATLQVKDRLVLYTSGETLVLTATTLGIDVFTRVHNLLVHLFEHDLSTDSYIKVATNYSKRLQQVEIVSGNEGENSEQIDSFVSMTEDFPVEGFMDYG